MGCFAVDLLVKWLDRNGLIRLYNIHVFLIPDTLYGHFSFIIRTFLS